MPQFSGLAWAEMDESGVEAFLAFRKTHPSQQWRKELLILK